MVKGRKCRQQLGNDSFLLYPALVKVFKANLDSHPLMDCVNVSQTQGVMLPITTIWEKELAPYKPNWDWIWENIPMMSKNPTQQVQLFQQVQTLS